MEGSNNSVVMLIITLVVGTFLVAIDKNAQPALVKLYKENREAVVYHEPEVQENV